jgi:hypothetical protein
MARYLDDDDGWQSRELMWIFSNKGTELSVSLRYRDRVNNYLDMAIAFKSVSVFMHSIAPLLKFFLRIKVIFAS